MDERVEETYTFVSTVTTPLEILGAIDSLRCEGFSLKIRAELVQESLQEGPSTLLTTKI